MRGRQILIEPRPGGGHAAALVIDGRLEDLLIDADPCEATPRPEAIYRAQVGRPMKGTGGVILDLGGGRTGFLRGPHPPSPGARALVQVSTWAEPGKAPPITDRLALKGRTAILTPGAPGLNVARSIRDAERRAALAALAETAMAGAPADLGLILRSAAEVAEAVEVASEIAVLRGACDTLSLDGPLGQIRPAPGARAEALREWPRPGERPVEGGTALAEAGIWEEIAALRLPTVALGEGRLAVEPTRALAAIDVNTGGDVSPAAALKANLAAAREIPRQLRLRGLGGQIVIDFAPLAKTDRRKIEAALTAALRVDGIDTTLAGWTPLGHLELIRKRARRPLS